MGQQLDVETDSLRKELEAAKHALRQIEKHHIRINLAAGRDPSRSKTLGIVWTVLPRESP